MSEARAAAGSSGAPNSPRCPESRWASPNPEGNHQIPSDWGGKHGWKHGAYAQERSGKVAKPGESCKTIQG